MQSSMPGGPPASPAVRHVRYPTPAPGGVEAAIALIDQPPTGMFAVPSALAYHPPQDIPCYLASP